MPDRREQNHKWYDGFDGARMQLHVIVGTVRYRVPAIYEVCGTCDGKGAHVNPSIDAHGISPEELSDDPDFREAYFAGHYDVRCVECNGRRVVPVPDETRMDPWLVKTVRDFRESFWADQAEQEHERRMGY